MNRHLLEEMAHYIHGHLKLFGKEKADIQSWKQLVPELPKDAIKDGQDCQNWQRVVTADLVSRSMAKVRSVAFGERLVSFLLLNFLPMLSSFL